MRNHICSHASCTHARPYAGSPEPRDARPGTPALCLIVCWWTPGARITLARRPGSSARIRLHLVMGTPVVRELVSDVLSTPTWHADQSTRSAPHRHTMLITPPRGAFTLGERNTCTPVDGCAHHEYSNTWCAIYFCLLLAF
ncbi:hypothetical protein [Ktedonobacter sp. SOSP1-52]|uniref:hypothetical protein n=1 Tax=Ktedonobacter sp. SOSP1-52 TaxID=2778366 RepID=UPI0019156CF5|nr:hypothetical protein [Ktedonobacter sp. SOSP1-52]